MALSQKHRVTLFTKLAPLVGEEETEAMLAEFPSSDLDVPATKDFVRAELHNEIGQLRAELHNEIGQLRGELHHETGELHRSLARLAAQVGQLEGQMQDQIGQLEVRIGERMRGQMIWLTGVVVAALGLLTALGG
ncbi:hypothetical protein BH20ACT3_BH20ACT3_03370 [soil metagenome]